jgi:uncharacterized membrane protein
MKIALENMINWVLTSSADATEVSLTVRGALIGAIPTIMALSGFAHINLGDGSILTGLFDGTAQFIQSALTVIAAAMTIFGALRKLYHLVVPANSISSI